MFLTQSDYDFTIKSEYLLQVIENDNSTRIEAELVAQSTIEDYLRHKFDVEAIFAQENSARNKSIIVCYVHLALYHLFSRVSPHQISEQRVTNYEESMKWLKSVAKGDITPNLPKLEQFETKSPRFLIDSKPAQDWQF